ncbi:hypothetical protein LV92_02980 [Arenibacter echinorum]|uniref:Uncharacterized protein n=1 Tax=Arenibacter echinorum TaxID=440515 RepID=A0A327R0T6_9FLAO|nr:hypothetical protein LV92_02980 [Arenibacter echinorum]
MKYRYSKVEGIKIDQNFNFQDVLLAIKNINTIGSFKTTSKD